MNIILTTLTSTSLLTTIFTNERPLLYIGGILSTLTLAFVIFQLSFDPGKEADRHRLTARELWYVREQYVNLLADIKENPDLLAICSRRDALIEELKKIYSGAPDTSSRAYRKAQTALNISEDMTFTDKEIDRFLPSALHIG